MGTRARLAHPKSAENTWSGQRDHAWLLVMITTGIRVGELVNLRRLDLSTSRPAHIAVIGKGRKHRITAPSAVSPEAPPSAAGLTGLRFHDLRHSAGTLAARTGATTKELMARLGHSSARASMIYQHAAEDRDRRIAEGLDEMAKQAGIGAQPGRPRSADEPHPIS